MVTLIFNFREFDLPRRHGSPIQLEKQLEIATRGALRVLELLDGFGVRAAIFCSPIFAKNREHILQKIVASGHNLASHTWNGTEFLELPRDDNHRIISAIPAYHFVKHNLPKGIFTTISIIKHRKRGDLLLPFEVWEFTTDALNFEYHIPWLKHRNSGEPMSYRLGSLIVEFKEAKVAFGTLAKHK